MLEKELNDLREHLKRIDQNIARKEKERLNENQNKDPLSIQEEILRYLLERIKDFSQDTTKVKAIDFVNESIIDNKYALRYANIPKSKSSVDICINPECIRRRDVKLSMKFYDLNNTIIETIDLFYPVFGCKNFIILIDCLKFNSEDLIVFSEEYHRYAFHLLNKSFKVSVSEDSIFFELLLWKICPSVYLALGHIFCVSFTYELCYFSYSISIYFLVSSNFFLSCFGSSIFKVPFLKLAFMSSSFTSSPT